MSELGLVEGDVCNRGACTGVMQRIDTDTSCSCHINPPCSHCVDACFACPECGYKTEPPDCSPKSTPIVGAAAWDIKNRKTPQQLFDELPSDQFGYVTIPGQYYWMEYKGKYPDGFPTEKILENFNTCFGFKWLESPKNGQFHLKVYTD